MDNAIAGCHAVCACALSAAAEFTPPATWDEVVAAYSLPDIPYIEPTITGDPAEGQLAISGLLPMVFTKGEMLCETGEGAGFLLPKNKRYQFPGEYDAETDTWSWESRNLSGFYSSMAVGEQTLSVFRLTME